VHALGSTAGAEDGIVCFTDLYCTITRTVAKTTYTDPEFLTCLDIEFAKRYFAAITAFAKDAESPPRPWRLLFDARSRYPEVEPVQFAAAGVNAHINYDLAPALLATWDAGFEPTDERRRDFDLVNKIFSEHMDALRERFKAALAAKGEDGDILDFVANRIGDLLVRRFRDNAWDDAFEVWTGRDRAGAEARLLRELDREASLFARGILDTPLLQFVS
jgi:hypothetical protein